MPKTDKIALYVVAAALVLGAILLGIFFYLKHLARVQDQSAGAASTSAQVKDLTPLIPEQLVQSMRTGQFQAALDEYERIIQKPNISSDEKALAVLNVAGARFNLTGTSSAWIQDVQALKQVVADPSVVIRSRAAALAELQVAYNYSGRDPAVFDEIYKDGPTKQYLVPNNPDLSAIQIGEASYAMRSAALSAIYTAQLYAAQYFLNPSQSASTTALYASRAESLLIKAIEAEKREASVAPDYEQSNRYFSYLQWYAITQGYLAVQKGEPYMSTFRNAFSQFFDFASNRTNPNTMDALLFTHFQYARILAALGDTAAEKEQITLLVEGLNTMPQNEISVFVTFLKNERTYRSSQATWQTITAMFALSPDFQQAVSARIGAK